MYATYKRPRPRNAAISSVRRVEKVASGLSRKAKYHPIKGITVSPLVGSNSGTSRYGVCVTGHDMPLSEPLGFMVSDRKIDRYSTEPSREDMGVERHDAGWSQRIRTRTSGAYPRG
jgi:hypothetical protein